MAKRSDIENTKCTTEGLAKMAVKLGYDSPFKQLYFNNGAAVSDLLEFFDDNPGAIEAVIQWVLDNDTDRDGNPLSDDEDDIDGDDDDEDDEEEDDG